MSGALRRLTALAAVTLTATAPAAAQELFELRPVAGHITKAYRVLNGDD